LSLQITEEWLRTKIKELEEKQDHYRDLRDVAYYDGAIDTLKKLLDELEAEQRR